MVTRYGHTLGNPLILSVVFAEQKHAGGGSALAPPACLCRPPLDITYRLRDVMGVGVASPLVAAHARGQVCARRPAPLSCDMKRMSRGAHQPLPPFAR